MSYIALYRKFRPLKFEEVVGEEHITQTLKNQIISNRIGHAYLFNGGRGTGKTTTAKILARAINCLNPVNGEPCNECEICKGILNESLTDVVEMDAASNNGVDDIRNIIEEVNFLPTIAKYRVYIIDEVHMLSTGAFNALLKTLEEPPEHVKFILATTEPQKLPATILSRCQRFDFKRLSNDDIVKRLKIICKESNIEINEEALQLLAILSEGAMRDAISILERCLQNEKSNVTVDIIKDLVGIPEFTYVNETTKAILEYNVQKAIEQIEQIKNQGKDINCFLIELLKYTKNILVYKTSKKTETYSKEEIKEIEKISNEITTQRLLQLIYDLSDLERDIKTTTQKQIVFEAGIIKLCNQKQDNQELIKRIEVLENKLKNINNLKEEKSIEKKETKNVEEIKPQKKAEPQPKAQEKSDLDFWDRVIAKLKEQGKIMIYTNLINTKAIEINDLLIGIEGLKDFGKTVIGKQENLKELEKIASIEAGKEIKIKIMDKSTNNSKKVIEETDLPINIIEE